MKTRISLALGAALLMAACGGGISTTTDWDPGFDFMAGTTYDWMDSEGQVDNITSSRIRSAADAAMAERGFTHSTDDPALVMSYQVTTDQRSSFNTVSTGWGGGSRWGSGWGGMSMGMSTARTTENVWTEGTLVLAIFDVPTKDMVWHGSATTDLDGSRSPEQRQELMDDAVDKMMRDFPPGG